jgi:hypothetical protein
MHYLSWAWHKVGGVALTQAVSEAWYQRHGIRGMVSEAWYQRHGIRDMVSEAWYQRHGIRGMVGDKRGGGQG